MKRTVRVVVAECDVPNTKSRQLLATFWRGALAFTDGKPLSANPYDDVPNAIGVTFSRAFQNYWRRGWKSAEDAAQAAT